MINPLAVVMENAGSAEKELQINKLLYIRFRLRNKYDDYIDVYVTEDDPTVLMIRGGCPLHIVPESSNACHMQVSWKDKL